MKLYNSYDFTSHKPKIKKLIFSRLHHLSIAILFIILMPSVAMEAQAGQKITYKKTENYTLDIEVISPTTSIPEGGYPCIVFFFGGGWNSGTTEQFRPQAEYFASRGMVSILADYRVKTRHDSSPFEALMDAKSAIRFVRENANKWDINPQKIVASGGSAGGHLAAATAVIEKFNDPNDNISVSCIPNALVLFNPVIDNGPGGYGYERVLNQYKDFSPIHNIRSGLPPCIFFLGTQDNLIPVETAEYYKVISEKTGNRCDLHLYQGGAHGFFNPVHPNFYSNTVNKTDSFLQSLGFLDVINIRPVIDTVGFAQYDWQMDSIVSRLSARTEQHPDQSWKAVIAPHDDYKYAGEVTWQVLSGVKAKTVILFGVGHRASQFQLEDQLVFGSFTHWKAPYGYIPVSSLQNEIMNRLDPSLWIVHDSMQRIEHSIEALTPFLQFTNRQVQIIPIIVPYMSFRKMNQLSDAFSKVLAEIMKERGLELGSDIALVVSNDAVHYGDEDWGGKNMAPFGTDPAGNEKALALEKEIISTCLLGELSSKKLKKFTEYTVEKNDYRSYKWTWCGRYSLPLGLLTATKLSRQLTKNDLTGELLNYATSIDHPLYPVEDIGMGTTAIATSRHWVGFVGVGYK